MTGHLTVLLYSYVVFAELMFLTSPLLKPLLFFSDSRRTVTQPVCFWRRCEAECIEQAPIRDAEATVITAFGPQFFTACHSLSLCLLISSHSTILKAKSLKNAGEKNSAAVKKGDV